MTFSLKRVEHNKYIYDGIIMVLKALTTILMNSNWPNVGTILVRKNLVIFIQQPNII